MKNSISRLTAFILVLFLLAGVTNASAAPTDYPDTNGHWAEETMLRALEDALINDDNGALKPDAPITLGEILDILCRVLAPGGAADLTGVSDIDESSPYYDVASKAVALGLAAPVNGRLNLDNPVTRGIVFVELTEAFQLESAAPDTSVLSNFSDGDTLTGKYRLAAAALVSGGYIEGFGGSLHMNSTITRAEFLTVFYKLIPNYKIPVQNSTSITGGAVYSGNAVVTNTQFTGPVYFDGTSSYIQLRNVTAPAVVLRSDNLSGLSLSTSKIDKFIFASTGGNLNFTPDFWSPVDTVTVGTGSGKLTLSGYIDNIEVTGSNRDVTINTSVKNLLISGSANTVTISPGVVINTIKILGAGGGNTVTLNGTCSECIIIGAGSELTGSGRVQMLRDYAKESIVSISADQEDINKDYGLNTVALDLSAPEEVASYELLKASVSITAPANDINYHGVWYLDDTYISGSDLSLAGTSSVLLETDIKDRGADPATRTLTFVLSCVTPDGIYQEIKAEKNITQLNQTKFDAQEVLDLVTTGYNGDYTLKWAQEHDYDNALKTEWVNIKGYDSKTEYLVWVNITYQRVNIFKGSAGNWTFDRTFIIGSGATGNDTPLGVFKVIGRSTRGWTTDTYTVKPVIFFINYAYGFHSRLYEPGTTTINDPRIGFPVSHGCIRMYDEDVAWFYDNIPTSTTVVVH